MSKAAMTQMLEVYQHNERHNTVAHTQYWCNQYKLLAKTAIEVLADPEQSDPVAHVRVVDGMLGGARRGTGMSKLPDGDYSVYTTLQPKQEQGEIERLTGALKRANSQAEHFEREWYLRGHELEQLKQEQSEPCGWQFYQDGKWHNGMETNNHRSNTEAAGVPVRDVYPEPQQRTWVDMTDEEILAAPKNLIACIAYVRNKLNEKNGIAPQGATND